MGSKTPTAIGIDLGTTYSCVAVYKNGRIIIIENNYSRRVTPSCVAFTEDNLILVGDEAKDNMLYDPVNTLFAVKRFIGRFFNDSCVQKVIKLLPFSVVADKDDKPMIEVEPVGRGLFHREIKRYSPEDISAEILGKMKRIAEDYLGCNVKDAVITIPASYNDSQRQATLEAAKLANLNVLRLLNEPTAAAIAYGMDNFDSVSDKNILVFDLGGGTLDVSILAVSKEHMFEVKSAAGDPHLGGEDFDNLLVKHFADQFRRETDGVDLMKDKRAVRRLTAACERAKIALSGGSETSSVRIDCLYKDRGLSTTLSRIQLDKMCDDLFQQAMVVVEEAIMLAGIPKEKVHEVILAGGSSRIPTMQKLLTNFFDGKQLRKDIAPEEAVAYGAAIMAAKLSGVKIDNAGINSMKLVDITSRSLGWEDSKGDMIVVIPRGTRIPVKKSCASRTTVDNQLSAVSEIYEGEAEKAAANDFLGKFVVSGFPAKPAGEVAFDMTMEIDDNGILHVSDVERLTGKANQITFTRRFGLSQ